MKNQNRQELHCPVCRTEIEREKKILVNYKPHIPAVGDENGQAVGPNNSPV
jgi:hypothetical protein